MLHSSEFEAIRPQLTAKAFRLLGSIHDAEDAVQIAWIRASTTGVDHVRNPSAWLTTVLARVCLDQLRTRNRRQEEPLDPGFVLADSVAADERYLQQEDVSRALMVVLTQLTASQRVAFVLHDLFGVPFTDIADTLGTSADNAKKHASRARQRIARARPPAPSCAVDAEVVEAFLAAAAGGDVERMITLMSDDCVRQADPSLLPRGAPTRSLGARAIAEETRLFADRIHASAPVFIDGRLTYVVAPGGHPHSTVDVTVRCRRVSLIKVSPIAPRATFAIPLSP